MQNFKVELIFSTSSQTMDDHSFVHFVSANTWIEAADKAKNLSRGYFAFSVWAWSAEAV